MVHRSHYGHSYGYQPVIVYQHPQRQIPVVQSAPVASSAIDTNTVLLIVGGLAVAGLLIYIAKK